MTVCTLDGVDPSMRSKLRPGVELAVAAVREDVAALFKGRLAGRLPQEEAGRIAGLIKGEARLSCRVVSTGKGEGPVRIRISILM